ncbi:hypothetical protein ACMFMG_011540 [Clarireedia jacksonii]
MPLLDLPAELLHKVLLHAVLAREVKRALRLRLVCKRFCQEIQSALFESQLLDSFYTWKVLSDWYIENDHGASKFWHSYLVYKVQSGAPQRRFLDILQVAQRVCQETSADLVTTIENLCWPALQEGTNPSNDNCKLENMPTDPELDLLCAAAYLNIIPLAKRLLAEGYCPSDDSVLFSSPMRLAAWAGNTQILEMFQEHLPELDAFDPPSMTGNWMGKLGPASMIGAAIRGDINMLRIAVYPPSRTTPESTDFMGESFGKVNRYSKTGNPLSLVQGITRDVEVYKYLGNFFGNNDLMSITLAKHARLGNLEMVRYLLDIGADIRGSDGRNSNPLVEACRRCHEDVVDLLLERGADPDFDGDENRLQGESAIAMAAKAGSLTIVRKLLNHGVDLSRDRMSMGFTVGYKALDGAVQAEHTTIVKLLLESGIDLEYYKEPIIKKALSEGLDSMAELL